MITFVRHSESKWNTREVTKNQDNTPLSDKGIKMCKKLKGNYDLVIISDTVRTRMTLEHSKVDYKNLKISKYCKEINKKSSNVEHFKKKLKKYLKLYNNILVISHRGYIRKLTGKNLKNLESISVASLEH